MVSTLLIAFRWKNLVLIFITQILLYYKFIHNTISFERQSLSLVDFLLLVFTTCIVCASGNVINDYYDYQADRTNSLKVKSSFTRKQLITVYFLLVIVGAVFAVYLSFRYGFYNSFLLYPLTVFFLWLYSYRLKCVAILGNVLIAIFTGAVVLLVPYAYWNELTILRMIDPAMWFQLIHAFLHLFIFTFLLNFYREIYKDIEDRTQDEMNQCRSTAVALGVPRAKQIAIMMLLFFAIVALFYIYSLHSMNMKIVFSIFLLLPTIFLIYFSIKSSTDKEFHQLSQYAKIMMALGLIFVLLN